MTGVGAVLLFVLLFLIFLGSRKVAFLSFAVGMLYLHQGLSVDVFGINLYSHRFLEMAGFGRIILRKEFRFINLNKIDKAFLFAYLYLIIVFVIRSSEGLITEIGYAVDALFSYFTFRVFITSIDDFEWFLKRFAVFLVPYVFMVLKELLTGRNPFSIFGANPYTGNYRAGFPRCDGSFRNSILMGSFAASFYPLYVGYLFKNSDKLFAFIGVGACTAIVAFSNSGGPLSGFTIATFGWILWHFRDNMRLVKICICVGLLSVAFFMEAPIWALPFKISQITGGGGYHRYRLLNKAIQDFDKWWLAGMPMEETIKWFPYYLSVGHGDITNYFLGFGIKAGLLSIILLSVLFIKSFNVVGKAMVLAKNSSGKATERYFIWGVGVMLVVHIANWFGVNYFDQMNLFWYMHLALVAMLADVKKNFST
jgi:hypothetical protein